MVSGAYSHVRVLREAECELLARAVRTSDGRRVLVQQLDPTSGSAGPSRLARAHAITRGLDIEGVAHPLSAPEESPPALVFEDPGGELLDGAPPVGLERFLRIGIATAHALHNLHAAGVVHRNLKPASILFDAQSGKATLLDLELASALPAEQPSAKSAFRIEGALPYMSPEQTGRTRYTVDARTDLYSLGITLFELRTGNLPFRAPDPLGFMHCHLALPAPALDQAAPGTPRVVAAIVQRLLAKAPADRYQSAVGLRHDLVRCLERLQPDGSIEPFALGERDVTERLHTPGKLYDRESQVQRLLHVFGQVVETGEPSVVLVSGQPGSGKTALVRKIEAPLLRQRGLFRSVKCDQLGPRMTESVLVRAIRELVLELREEPEEILGPWRAALAETLGTHARPLVDVIPELEALVSPQPRLSPTPFAEEDQHFRVLLVELFSVLARHEHPVVLVFDDMQWIDPESLVLLTELLDRGRHLLLVGTYRDTEVDSSHPLAELMRGLCAAGTSVEEIALPPLSLADVTDLIADALHAPSSRAGELARCVYELTAGNPLFTWQLLTTLHDDGLISFDPGAGSFRYDLPAIRARGFSDNVIDLMLSALRKLPASARAPLENAAAIGHSFDLASLAALCGRDEKALQDDLAPALRAGLIVRTERGMEFVHDRVQQAAYSLVSEGRRAELHLQVGRVLLTRASQEELDHRASSIVAHLNQGAALLEDEEEKTRVAELNLVAAVRARAATSFAAALEHVACGLTLLPPDRWVRFHDLTWNLRLEEARSAQLNIDLARAERAVSELLAHARTRADQADAYQILIQARASQSDFIGACSVAIEFLRTFRIEVPLHPSPEREATTLRDLLARLGSLKNEDLIDLPLMQSADWNGLMQVLTSASTAAFVADAKLWTVLACLRVSLTLEHGVCPASAHALGALAVRIIVDLDEHEEGRRLGDVALSWVDRRGLSAYGAAAYLNAGVMLRYWLEPLDRVSTYVRETMDRALESGSMKYAGCLAAICASYAHLARGTNLEVAADALKAPFELVARYRFVGGAGSLRVSRWFIERMSGRELRLDKLRGAGDAQSSELEEGMATEEERIPVMRFQHFVRSLELAVYFERYAEAASFAELAAQLRPTMPGMIPVADYVFYSAIAHARTGDTEKAAIHEAQLARWARVCPENFRDRSELVLAEIARAKGDVLAAERLYEQAIGSARDQGFVHHQGLAYELAASFYEARGFGLIAETYRREARARYERWGAHAKVRALDERYAGLAPARAFAASATFSAGITDLDLLAIVKASQAISQELGLDDLCRALLQAAVEQGSAQRACLLSMRDGMLTIDARAELGDRGVQVELHAGAPLHDALVVPHSIVEAAARTGERVLYDDATLSPFASDLYIVEKRPRSVLCLPILRQARAVAYLYLENQSLAGAFGAERLTALELLASQAAISLENARFVEATRKLNASLEAEIRERRSAERALRESEAALRASENRLYEYLDGLPLGTFVLDAMTGKPMFMNRAAVEVLGRELDTSVSVEQFAAHYEAYIAGTDLLYPAERAPLARAVRGERSFADDIEIRRDGRRIPLAAWGSPVGLEHGAVRYAIVAFHDISAQRAAEAKHARLEEQLRRAERLESIGRLAGGVAHDFNNLLTPMLAYAELATRTLPEDSPACAYIDQVRSAAERAAELTRQLLAFGRRQLLAPKLIDLNAELANSRQMLRRLIREDIRIVMHLAQDLDRVRADPAQLQRVVVNLIMNAADAMPHGGTLDIETENVVRLSSAEASEAPSPLGACVALRVRDSGHGMDRETLANIFEPFFSTKAPGHGTGLGMPTAYGIVRQHGGQLSVQSELGVGTTVEVFLPRAAEGQLPDAQGQGSEAALVVPSGRGEVILVVEDSPAVRDVVRHVLCRQGYRVVASAGPLEALEAARALLGNIDLLVTDVVMPVMNGRELYEKLTCEHPGVPALFISGHSEEVVSRRGLLEPGLELLAKPFTIDALTRRVSAILARNQGRGRSSTPQSPSDTSTQEREAEGLAAPRRPHRSESR